MHDSIASMTRFLAFLYGVVFVGIGILGFLPEISPNGMLFYAFHVNIAHNIIHIVIGLFAFWAMYRSSMASKICLQLLGMLFGAWAVFGFFYGPRPIFDFIANNLPDAWLYLVLSILTLYLGFAIPSKPAAPTS